MGEALSELEISLPTVHTVPVLTQIAGLESLGVLECVGAVVDGTLSV